VVGLDRRTVIEDVEFDETAERVVVHVRPRRRRQPPRLQGGNFARN
jgi:hypothetical protein